MWYMNSVKQELDYSKPICATSHSTGNVYLLVPSNKDKSYEFRGFDWINVETGKYNSCSNFSTVKEAIKPYLKGYDIANCVINLKNQGEQQ